VRQERARSQPPLRALAWDEEQRRLGVGVKVRRRDFDAVHAAALQDAASRLLRGRSDALDDVVEQHMRALRGRLWRAPAWRSRLRRSGLSPEDLAGPGDLEAFPTTDRDQYALEWDAFSDVDEDPELHVATSSGSTGQALLALRSGFDGVYMWAVLRFWLEALGVTLTARPRLVLLDTLPGGLEYSVRARWFDGGALHRISTQRPGPVARLRRARPAVLSTDPAGLRFLCAQADVPRPALLLSSAQRLDAALRAEAEARLEAPIVNYYATTETGPIAWECLREHGRFHVLHPDVLVESLGRRLAVTRLRPSPLPLLRYLTGDTGDVVDGACSCGARGRSIVGFVGRERAEFVAPDGAAVDAWSLSWLFKDLPLVRFEMTQVGEQHFEVRHEGPLPMGRPLLVERLRRVLVRTGFPAPEVRLVEGPLPAKPTPFRRLWPGR
jgi:phenylacetate-CoA ligase